MSPVVLIFFGLLCSCSFEKFQDTYGNLDVDDANLDGKSK